MPEPDYECSKCGGLVHATFGDESYDGFFLVKKCDLCGDDYEIE